MPAVPGRHVSSLCLSKDGDARLLGHLDFARVVERSLRRSGLPVRYTEGFNPRFRISFTEALPVGLASTGEWVTVIMTEDVAPDEIRAKLTPALPEAVRLVAVRRGEPPADAGIVCYRLSIVDGESSTTDALTALLTRDAMLVADARKGVVDARALLADGRVHQGFLELDLVADNGRPPRPGPVLAALRELAGPRTLRFGVATKQADRARPGERPCPDAARIPSASC